MLKQNDVIGVKGGQEDLKQETGNTSAFIAHFLSNR